MMAQARLRKASWMSSRISQRIRSRRNQCSSAMDLLHHPAVGAQPRAVRGAAAGDHGRDALLPYLLAVLVVVVAAVSVDPVRALTGPPAAAAYRRDRLDQGHELGDVVAVAAGQRDRQRDAVRFGDQVVLRAGPGTVDRARAGFGPPFIARMCEPSITALDQSSAPAAFSSASSDSCSRCHTPASCQSRSRRQQVIPEPKPSSCGKNSHGIPVYRTNKIPDRTFRSSSRLRPGWSARRGTTGSSGSIRSHNPSGTIHGGCWPFLTDLLNHHSITAIPTSHSVRGSKTKGPQANKPSTP